MKIAVALFGIPRGFAITIPRIEQLLAEMSKDFELIVRFHLFKVKWIDNPRSNEKYSLSDQAYDWCSAYEGDIEPPEAVPDDQVNDVLAQSGDQYADGQKSLRNMLHQLHSLRHVTAQISPHKPDVVAYLRPDLYYHTFPDARWLRRLAATPKTCVVPSWQWWGGINDRFSFCASESYRAYGNREACLHTFLKKHPNQLHAETLLRFAMTSAGTKVRTTNMQASRVRENDRIVAENFDPIATRGTSFLQRVRHITSTRLPIGWPWNDGKSI